MNTNVSETSSPRPTAYKHRAGLLIAVLALLLATFSSTVHAQTGVVLGCGYNGEGELGNGTATNSLLITPVSNLTSIKAIAGGSSHTLALDANGNVWAWGLNGNGQLGTGDKVDRHTPVLVLA